MTAQGQPRTVFRRAIATENVVAAELNVRLMGNVSLVEALKLAVQDPKRGSRYAARWPTGFLSERPGVTLEDVGQRRRVPRRAAARSGCRDVAQERGGLRVVSAIEAIRT
jgi:hypothetical protein